MFNQGGLSLNQAPPISVVLRFFVTGTVFGLFCGIFLLFWDQSRILDKYSPYALVFTHALSLGVVASFMLGSLFQMLPVIAGVVLKNPLKKATFVHLLFSAGVVFLLLAFFYQIKVFYITAALLLGVSLLYTLFITLRELFILKDHSFSSKGMLFSLLGFLSAIIFALYLLGALANIFEATRYLQIKEAHYSFALFGWVALLIVSISFQVIEMFYVTPPYPKIISSYFTVAIFSLLILKLFLLFWGEFSYVADIIIAALFIVYGVFTLHRLYKRKRPTSDATVWFWRFGMSMLIISMLLWIASHFSQNSFLHRIDYITFSFFALSVIFAMVYKIVPFLVWFHLSNEGYMKAPLMHDIVHPKRVKIHFYMHMTLFVLWIIGCFFPAVSPLSALLVIVSFGWLLYHLIYAVYLYRHTQKHSEKMSW